MASGFTLRTMLLIGVLSLAGLAFVPQVRAGEFDSKVSDLQLRELFPGTFQGFALGVIKVNIEAHTNGSLLIRLRNDFDTGTWAIRSAHLCISLKHFLKGHLRCSEVTLRDGWYHAVDVMFQPMTADAVAVQ